MKDYLVRLWYNDGVCCEPSRGNGNENWFGIQQWLGHLIHELFWQRGEFIGANHFRKEELTGEEFLVGSIFLFFKCLKDLANEVFVGRLGGGA